MTSRAAAPIALTMGEPAGIGGEITLKAWRDRPPDGPAFFAIDDPDRLARTGEASGLPVPLRTIESPADASRAFGEALPVLPLGPVKAVRPGKPDPANGSAVLGAIDRAVALARSGEAAGIVTNPVHKATLYAAGFGHPGHTEYLEALAGNGAKAQMMLAVPGLRVVPVTVHLPLARAVAQLSTETIVRAGIAAGVALRQDFGIAAPRLAVAALNPHAGESGALGAEEETVIEPAIEQLRAQGFEVTGPAPADTLFHPAARARYDAALCMYHDQALIPIKTIDFERGVNITLGLPFVRTSPDHGTAFGIAGSGEASAASLVAAIGAAAEIAGHRARAKAARDVA